MFQVSLLEMSTPRYFADETISRQHAWREKVDGITFLDLVISITWNLLGLNSMSHFSSHTSSFFISSWRKLAEL